MEMPGGLSDISAGRGGVDQKTKRILLLLLFLPCLFIPLKLDNDIWFLLNSGRYVLQYGIPTLEPFALHENMRFVMQQWLSCVAFWSVYSRLGAAGLLALVFLVYASIVAVAYRLAALLSGGNFAAAWIAAFLTSALLCVFMITRPVIFTLFILILELYLCERFIASRKAALLLPLPLLSALLVNLHAAMWPVQFVLLLPYIVDSFRFKAGLIEGQGYPKKILFPAFAAMFAAGFLNPYGFRAMSYLFRSYGYAQINQVMEMLPANINNTLGKLIFGTLFLIAAIYVFYRKGETRLRFALLTAGTAVLALSSTRSFTLFILCSLFPLSYYLKGVSIPEHKMKRTNSTRWLRTALSVILAGMLIYVLGGRIASFVKTESYPACAQAVDYLNTSEDRGRMRLYTGYNDGGYAEYMGLKPYIDPRAEVFVEKNNGIADIMQEYYSLQTGGIFYKDVLEKYGFTHLLISDGDILSTYLPHDEDYTLVYSDGAYAVYRKR